MKCLEIARLQDFGPNTLGLLAGGLERPPDPLPRDARLVMRVDDPPPRKFLPTGLGTIPVFDSIEDMNIYLKFEDRYTCLDMC